MTSVPLQSILPVISNGTSSASYKLSARGWRGSAITMHGYQRHHILPRILLMRSQFAEFFRWLRQFGFGLRDFRRNGVLLPSGESEAWRTGKAMHRGPHPAYSDVVISRVETIRSASVATLSQAGGEGAYRFVAYDAIARLDILQRATRRALNGSGNSALWLHRRDPMRLFGDCAALDRAIYDLFPD